MIMNIGANGPGIYFSKYLGLKLQSPIDNMQCYNFKSILISTNISQLNITFNELNDILSTKIFSMTADIDGEIDEPNATVDRFYFTFITDNY